jgi:hypothetical protein
MRSDEMRLIIRPEGGATNSPRAIPADVFHKAFSTILALLKAADAEAPFSCHT